MARRTLSAKTERVTFKCDKRLLDIVDRTCVFLELDRNELLRRLIHEQRLGARQLPRPKKPEKPLRPAGARKVVEPWTVYLTDDAAEYLRTLSDVCDMGMTSVLTWLILDYHGMWPLESFKREG